MAKKKTRKTVMYVTVSLGLFYLRIELDGSDTEIIGPFKTLGQAEAEQSRRAKIAASRDKR